MKLTNKDIAMKILADIMENATYDISEKVLRDYDIKISESRAEAICEAIEKEIGIFETKHEKRLNKA